MLSKLNYILEEAEKKQKIVASFSVKSTEMAKGIIEAAESKKVSIVMRFSEEIISKGSVEVAEIVNMCNKAKVDICPVLSETTDIEFIKNTIKDGFTCVMLKKEFDNIADSVKFGEEVVDIAKTYDANIIARIGNVNKTNELVSEYVKEVDVDAINCFYPNGFDNNVAIIGEISSKVNMPLTLSVIGEIENVDYAALYKNGIRLINFHITEDNVVAKCEEKIDKVNL